MSDVDKFLAAAHLEESQASNDPGLSVAEWGESWGVTPTQALVKLKRLKKLGAATCGKAIKPCGESTRRVTVWEIKV
jgi:hypothetical protein